MTTFVLSQEPAIKRDGKEPEDGRVILDVKEHGPLIGSIEADAITRTVQTEDGPVEKIMKSAWLVAREKVDESKFYHIENFGWLARKAEA